MIISNIQKLLGKGSVLVTDSVVNHSIADSSCIKLQKELDHPKKGFINIQNIDDNNECFKWFK